MHCLVDNIQDESHHFLTAQAQFYRTELSFDCRNPRMEFIGGDEWIQNACSICHNVYNPDKHNQIYCTGCKRWFCIDHNEVKICTERSREVEVRTLDRITPIEAMTAFKKGPIVRGKSWTDTLYPPDIHPAQTGWLMTGNQAIHELGGLEYPGQHYEDLAFTYKVDSKAAPESVKIAMFEAITKVNKIWVCPTCNSDM